MCLPLTPAANHGCVVVVVAIAQATIDLYQANAKSLIAYASTLVGPSNAEDLVSNAMVRVFDRVDLGTVENPRGYLFTAVLNQARSEGRSSLARRRRESAALAPERTTSTGPSSGLDELGVLGDLSTRERAVIYLTYWEDMAVADVADCLGVSDGSVRSYLARARDKIRKAIHQ